MKHSKEILFLGNSHAAAISLSVSEQFVSTEYKIDYVAEGGDFLLPNLRYENHCLSSEIPRIQKALCRSGYYRNNKLDLRQYRHIIIYGCGLIAGNDWMNIVRQSNAFFSTQARMQSYEDYAVTNSHYTFLSSLQHTEHQKKILSVPSPPPSIHHPLVQKIKEANLSHIDQFTQIVETRIRQWGGDYMPIPEPIWAPNRYSASEIYHNKKDISHLSPQGGGVVLEAMLRIIRARDSRTD